MRGAYVLFLSNSTDTLKGIAEAFNPPLPVPEASTVTITKQYSNNTTETITENLLMVVGRTYKNIDGRIVPEGIIITVHYNTPEKLNDAIQKALNDIPGQIMEVELNLNNSKGR